MLAALFSLPETEGLVVFVQCGLLVLQVTMQGMIISETSRRVCTTRAQQAAKPGRQIITFLHSSNITVWVFDTFMSHRNITQGIQTRLYELLAWPGLAWPGQFLLSPLLHLFLLSSLLLLLCRRIHLLRHLGADLPRLELHRRHDRHRARLHFQKRRRQL